MSLMGLKPKRLRGRLQRHRQRGVRGAVGHSHHIIFTLKHHLDEALKSHRDTVGVPEQPDGTVLSTASSPGLHTQLMGGGAAHVTGGLKPSAHDAALVEECV